MYYRNLREPLALAVCCVGQRPELVARIADEAAARPEALKAANFQVLFIGA